MSSCRATNAKRRVASVPAYDWLDQLQRRRVIHGHDDVTHVWGDVDDGDDL